MKLTNFIKPAALLVAGSIASSANAATVIEDDIFATREGTLINIGGVQTPQFRFTTQYVFGDPTAGLGDKYLLQSNDGVAGTRVVSSDPYDTNTDGGVITGFNELGGLGFPEVGLRFSIGDTFYEGTAELTGNGDVIDRITYDVAAAAGVPEPATWALMILGMGAVGGALRTSRKRQPSLANA